MKVRHIGWWILFVVSLAITALTAPIWWQLLGWL